MQRFINFFMIFALNLAAHVSVYNDLDLYRRRSDTKPVFESAAPWKFGFTSGDWLYMATIYYINPSPSVTTLSVSYESDPVTIKMSTVTLSNGKKFHVFFRQLSGPEAIINLNLYTSNGLCTSIRVAEGKVVSEKSEKEYKYSDICFKGLTKPCVLEVDLNDVICNEPSNVTQKNENLKTTTPLTDLENNNTTFVSTNSSANKTEPSNVTQKNENLKTTTPLTDLENNNTTFVSTNSSANKTEPSNVTQKNENLKTTTPLTDLENNNTTFVSTNSSANKTDQWTTNNTIITIVGSLSGITLVLLAIIAIRRRCWMHHSPQGTSDLPTNQNNQPFYVNLLFRRECDEEIAEIDQHHYEEITPQVSTEGG